MSVAAPTEASSATYTELPYRRALKMTVNALVHDAGFAAAEDSALETLTEMLQSCECQNCTLWVDSQLSGSSDSHGMGRPPISPNLISPNPVLD